MGRMRLALCTVALLGLMLGACAVRAPKSNGMDQSAALDARSLGLAEVRGEVVRIAPEAGTLRVRGEDDREIELRVGEGTPVFFQGSVSSLDDITEGSPVRAAYVVEGRRKVATWVEIPRPDPNRRPAREPIEPDPAADETLPP